MKYKSLPDLARVCAIVLAPGLLAWLFGRPTIFPSLGPSALAIVLDHRVTAAVVVMFLSYRSDTPSL
jgi:hypothetical protein